MDARIDSLQRKAAGDPSVVGLAGGLPTEVQFPRRALGQAFVRALGAQGAPALQYGWPEGSLKLRQWIAGRLQQRGAEVEAGDVLITSGAQQAIAIAAQLLCRAGTRIAVDRETYPAALDLFRTRGARPVVGRARVHYAMPAVGNPHGASLPVKHRGALLASGAAVIEDDAYAELRFEGPPPRPLLADARDRVWHVGTFSKVLCPGLRVGWLVPPPRMRDRALRVKHDLDLQSNGLAQAVLEEFLARDPFDTRVAALRRFYGARAARLASALRRHLPAWRFEPAKGGFAIWVEPDAPFDERALLARAVERGVSFDPGSMFRPGHTSEPPALRLCFSSVARANQLDEGVRRLARTWREYQDENQLAGRFHVAITYRDEGKSTHG